MSKTELLSLDSLKMGQELTITTGLNGDSSNYRFKVLKPGIMPLGYLFETDVDGNTTSARVQLEGTFVGLNGMRNNLLQSELEDLSIAYGRIRKGGHIIVSDPLAMPPERIFLNPQCSAFEVQ